MKVFELHFNPRAKDIVFDSFVYEPENISERNLGSLYMVGQVSNALPQDLELLNQIAGIIKTEYYSNLQRQAETAFKESLKKANEFLNKTAKEGKVSWLGNLNFAVVSLKEAGFSPLTISLNNVPFALNFAQTGDVKILLLRGREIMDISQNLEFQGNEVYPLKVFENIVSGKLVQEDKLMILTKEIFEHLSNKNSIGGFSRVTDEKVLNEILKPLRKELSEISGALLFVGLTKTPQKMNRLSQAKIPVLLKPTFISIKWPSFSNISTAALFKSKLNNGVKRQVTPARTKEITQSPSLRKKIGLVILLGLVFALTFYAFKGEREKELKLTEQILTEVEAQKIQAQNFLIFKEKDRANRLLQAAWLKIVPLTESNSSLSEKTTALKKSIEKELATLNQMEIISDPELIFEIPALEIGLLPKRMLFMEFEGDQYFYFSNPHSANFYQLSQESKEGKILKAARNLKLAAVFEDSILYFCTPNILLQYLPKNDQFQEFSLSCGGESEPELNPADFKVYYNNLYFLESTSKKIIKFDLINRKNQTLVGENWINSNGKEMAENGKSIAIDGNIWVLNERNQIDRYYQKEYKNSLDLNLFPFVENPVKIWTSASNSYLYLLEPAKNRIVILNKYGELLRQYQSEQFDNLLDFAVSKDGKSIYLLAGSKVYRITVEIQ